MLSKLIKYDFKVQMKFLIGVYGVLAVIALIACGLLGLKNVFLDIMPIQYAATLLKVFLIIASVLVVAVTFIYGILHFRRNLYKDEGYLMNTLPVTGTKLYISKIVSVSVCVVLSCVAAIVLYGVGTQDILWFFHIVKEIGAEFGAGFVLPKVLCMFYFVLMIPGTLIQIFMCLSVGYTWKTNSNINRDVLSVIVYVICYFVQQIFMTLALLAFFMLYFHGVSVDEIATINSAKDAVQYVSVILGMGIVYSVLTSGVMAAVSLRRMNHHINLE